MITFPDMTFTGPPVDDPEIFKQLPPALATLLQERNGFVAYGGGLHIRGACSEPAWHSLRAAWQGSNALHAKFSSVEQSDIPLGEDALGDQFLLRGTEVWQLHAETDDVDRLAPSLERFLEAVGADPVDVLGLHPLIEFRSEGAHLKPGQLLSAYPPFSSEQSADGVDLRAVPAADRLAFLADFARQVHSIPEGGQIRVQPTD